MRIKSRIIRFLVCSGAAIAMTHAGSMKGAEVTLNMDATTVTHIMRGGFGASWHAIEQPIPVEGDRSHGGSAWGGNPPANDRRAWGQIYRHADWLGLDFVRVELEQRMFQPEKDRFTWDSAEMRILYPILDWCESRHADVFMQCMWGNVEWNSFPEFREDPISESNIHITRPILTQLKSPVRNQTHGNRRDRAVLIEREGLHMSRLAKWLTIKRLYRARKFHGHVAADAKEALINSAPSGSKTVDGSLLASAATTLTCS